MPVSQQPGACPAFRPAWWCRNPHLQTLWPVFFRRRPRPSFRSERIELDDGDFIDLDWLGAPSASGSLILLLHGLEGNSDSHYIRGAAAALANDGHGIVVMHFRGCSGEPNRLDRLYHSGETSDLREIVALLRERWPAPALGVLGYSLGGNVLLKWLGESGPDPGVDAALAVSVPFRLDVASEWLDRGFARVYRHRLLMALRASLRRKYRHRAPPIDLSRLSDWNSFREFDHHVTARLHGFASAGDYYHHASSRRYLAGICCPTLIVHARDDPFMGPDVVPETTELSTTTELELTERGGHVGFVAGSWPGRARYWLDQRTRAYFAGLSRR